jgi:hypothetical protein
VPLRNLAYLYVVLVYTTVCTHIKFWQEHVKPGHYDKDYLVVSQKTTFCHHLLSGADGLGEPEIKQYNFMIVFGGTPWTLVIC